MTHNPTDLRILFQDHPVARVALWHIDGIKLEGYSPDAWLTDDERLQMMEFSNETRRKEWTAARIALKQLLVRDGVIRSPMKAEIRQDEKGKPKVVSFNPDTGEYMEFSCSLSHKNSLVLVGYAMNHVRIGVDIERRSWRLSMVRRKFENEKDRLLISGDSIAKCAVLWSFKEATSKLIGTGYACGFSTISCQETRYGVCELQQGEENLFEGVYLLFPDNYAITLVTDWPYAAAKSPAIERPKRSWRERAARARKLRHLRHQRAMAAVAKQAADSAANARQQTEDASGEAPEPAQ